jgi:hypothetical protein
MQDDISGVGFVNSVVVDLQGNLAAPGADHRRVLSARARRLENADGSHCRNLIACFLAGD